MPVGLGDHLAHDGLRVIGGLDIGAVLVDVLLNGNEQVQVGEDVHVAQAVVAEEHVRQVAAGQQQRLLLSPVGIARILPVDVHVGGFLHLLEHAVLVEIPQAGALHIQEGQADGLVDDGIAGGVEVGVSRLRAALAALFRGLSALLLAGSAAFAAAGGSTAGVVSAAAGREQRSHQAQGQQQAQSLFPILLHDFLLLSITDKFILTAAGRFSWPRCHRFSP